MTNQEAAEMIRDDMKLHHGFLSGEYRKALSMAISALQAQDSPKPKAESVQNVQNEDLISRKAAIDVLATMQGLCTSKAALVQNSKIWQQIKDLPSAQPERLTDDDFETIRIHLNAYKEKLCNQGRWKEAVKYQNIIDRFMAFASAQPEPQWIPVAERLPEEGQSILVTADGWRMVAIIRTFFKDMHKDIIAWMPLPEPYKAERRTDDLQ